MNKELPAVDGLRVVLLGASELEHDRGAITRPARPDDDDGTLCGYPVASEHEGAVMEVLPSLTARFRAFMSDLKTSAPSLHETVLTLKRARATTEAMAREHEDPRALAVAAILDGVSIALLHDLESSGGESFPMIEKIARFVKELHQKQSDANWNDCGPATRRDKARELSAVLERVTDEIGAIDGRTDKPLGRRLTRREVVWDVLTPRLFPIVRNPALRNRAALAEAIYDELPISEHGNATDRTRASLDDPFAVEPRAAIRAALRACGYTTSEANDATKGL